MKNNLIYILGAIAIIALVLSIINLGGDGKLGSATHFSGPIDSEEGFTVDDISVIDGSGNISTANNLTITGETNLDTLVQGGTVTSITASSSEGRWTITPANICDSTLIKINTIGTSSTDTNVSDIAGTWYIPTSTDLIADCIPAVGDFKEVRIQNAATSTYTLSFSHVSVQRSFLDFLWDTATSTDSTASSISLDAGEFMLITFQNYDGVTTTVEFTPLIHE